MTGKERVEASEQRRLRAAWVSFLKRARWHHFGHLTSAADTPTHELFEVELCRFRSRLENLARNAIWMAVAYEWNTGRLHAHVVIGGTDMLTCEAVQGAWRGGLALVARFDPGAQGLDYMTKSVPTGHAELDIIGHPFKDARRWRRLRKKQAQGTAPLPDTSAAAQRTADNGMVRRERLLRRRGTNLLQVR